MGFEVYGSGPTCCSFRRNAMLIVGIPFLLFVLWASTSAAAQSDGIGFGFHAYDHQHVSNADFPSPEYESVWAVNKGNPDGLQDYVGSDLDKIESRGRTPVVHFYYWGDNISPSNVENGHYDESEERQYNKSDWNAEADRLVNQIENKMDGKETIVTIELEFHKNGPRPELAGDEEPA